MTAFIALQSNRKSRRLRDIEPKDNRPLISCPCLPAELRRRRSADVREQGTQSTLASQYVIVSRENSMYTLRLSREAGFCWISVRFLVPTELQMIGRGPVGR